MQFFCLFLLKHKCGKESHQSLIVGETAFSFLVSTNWLAPSSFYPFLRCIMLGQKKVIITQKRYTPLMMILGSLGTIRNECESHLILLESIEESVKNLIIKCKDKVKASLQRWEKSESFLETHYSKSQFFVQIFWQNFIFGHICP